jgi:hypothetical protein
MAVDYSSDFAGNLDTSSDNSSSVPLQGYTGKQDSGSIWGTGLLSTLGTATNTGLGIYNQIKGVSPAKPATPPVVGSAPSSNWQQYLPWAIGAVVLLVVVGVIFKKR